MKKPRRDVPIPVFGVPLEVKPDRFRHLKLYWHPQEGINWVVGQIASKQQLEDAIAAAAGLRLPNDLLPALDPGDVIEIQEGTYWIDRDWKVLPLPSTSSPDCIS
jgi:hypothetical protein